MGKMLTGDFTVLAKIVAPSQLLNHYDDPDRLEQKVKAHVRKCWPKYTDSILFSEPWHNDLVKLIDNWMHNKELNGNIINRWCSDTDYSLIKAGQFSRVYPKPLPNFTKLNFDSGVAEWPVQKPIQYSVSTKNNEFWIMIHSDREKYRYFNNAIQDLLFSHLFFCIHAGYEKLDGYRLDLKRLK